MMRGPRRYDPALSSTRGLSACAAASITAPDPTDKKIPGFLAIFSVSPTNNQELTLRNMKKFKIQIPFSTPCWAVTQAR
jgi:hypothetical protein